MYRCRDCGYVGDEPDKEYTVGVLEEPYVLVCEHCQSDRISSVNEEPEVSV